MPSRFAPVRFFSSPPSVADVVAGVSVALVLIPQSLAYAAIAGLPQYVGLLTATIPLLVAAPFVSCRYLQTGPVAVTSLLTLGALASVAEQGTAEYVKLASLLAIVVGVVRLALGVFKLGAFTKLLRAPVVTGFTTGAAILIVSSQLPRALGSDPHSDWGVIRRAGWAIGNPNSWASSAIGISLLTAALVVGGRRVHKLFPSVLAAVVVALVVSRWTGYSGEIIGALPNDFPTFSADLPWGRLGDIIIPGVVIAFVGFAEPASIALQFSAEDDLEWDPSQELRGGGLANLTSAFVGGYPIGGSFSRSALNRFAGATSSWSGMITGLCVLAALPIVPILEDLPRAALSAIIIVALVRLIKVKEIYQLLQTHRLDAAVAIITLAATLISAPRLERGVMVGVAVGVLAMVWEKRQSADEPTDTDAVLSGRNDSNGIQ